MKNSILKLVPKPSDLVLAMIKGLEKQSKRKGFGVSMSTFGSMGYNMGYHNNPKKKDLCFGCAATCTIQQIAKKNFKDPSISSRGRRAEFLGFKYHELEKLEHAINLFRQGEENIDMEPLDNLYGHAVPLPIKKLPYLSTARWKTRLKAYKAYYQQLKKCEL